VRRAKWFRVLFQQFLLRSELSYSNSRFERLQVPLRFGRSLDLRSRSAGKHP
jgi:hypothetical protein